MIIASFYDTLIWYQIDSSCFEFDRVMIVMKLRIAHLFEGPGCFDTTFPEINLVFYLELPDLDMVPN